MFSSLKSKIFLEAKKSYLSSLPAVYLDILKLPQKIKDHKQYKNLPEWYKNELKFTKYDRRKYKNKYLYLINFEEQLSSSEAFKKIQNLGLIPADIIETALLFLEQKPKIKKYSPIIAIEAFRNQSKLILGGVPLSLNILNDTNIDKPGEIEVAEYALGAKFSKGVYFLVTTP